MPHNGGAIIHITCDILKRLNRKEDFFTVPEIVDSYLKLKNDPRITKLKLKFGKQGRSNTILTFENETLMKGWLNKHTYIKEVFWFERGKHQTYKIKKKHFVRLDRELAEMNLNNTA